jgi:hypothetical protein
MGSPRLGETSMSDRAKSVRQTATRTGHPEKGPHPAHRQVGDPLRRDNESGRHHEEGGRLVDAETKPQASCFFWS